MTSPDENQIEAALEALRDALGDVAFSLTGPDREPLEVERRRLGKSISDYLLPRVRTDKAIPVVALIAGAGGVGKSTLLNSLAQTDVSQVGLARPTTRHPVIWANRRPPDDFWGQFIGRVQEAAGRNVDVVVGHGAMTSDLVLVDTPPLDLDAASPARDLLTVADLCIFVTSASRYADAAPFDFLAHANRQGVPVLFVMNKTPGDPWLTVDLVNDFAARLARRGLLPSPNPSLVFRLTTDPLSRPHHGLDEAAIAPLREELESLADPVFRDAILSQTTAATLHAVTERSADLAGKLQVDTTHVVALRDAVDGAYVEQSRRLEEEVAAGAFAPVARRRAFTEAAAELAGIVTRRAGVASGRAAGAWEGLDGGPRLLTRGGGGLYRHGEDTPYEAVEIIEAWEQEAAERALGAAGGRVSSFTKRRVRRFLWRAALDPDLKLPGSIVRKYGDEVGAIVTAARESLAAAMLDAMGRDAERFLALVRDPVPADKLSRLEGAVIALAGVTNQAEEAARVLGDEQPLPSASAGDQASVDLRSDPLAVLTGPTTDPSGVPGA
jgi:hypothetical protein